MKVGIYGLGRFGSFWAKEFAKLGIEVLGYSRTKKEEIEGVKQVSEEEILSQSDYLFFCVAISSFEKVLKNVKDKIGKNTVVCDTCSVKTMPAKWMKENLSSDIYKIATHPMFGPDSGKNGLLGLPLVMCPISEIDDRYKKLKELFIKMDLTVLEMSSREHDKEAAYSQGVTHFVGRTLDRMSMKPTPIATRGYENLMTIVEQTCNDPMTLFYDLQRFNPYAKEMRLSLQIAIEKVLNELEEQEEE